MTLLGGFDGGDNFHKTDEKSLRFRLCQLNCPTGPKTRAKTLSSVLFLRVRERAGAIPPLLSPAVRATTYDRAAIQTNRAAR